MSILALSAPLVGILGVLIGIALNEFLRRKNRVEQYAPVIFEKRLRAYEGLANLINNGSTIADDVIHNPKLSHTERHEMVSSVVFPIAMYTDNNRLYIDDELAAHCTAIFMGVEDIFDSGEDDKDELLKSFYQMRLDAYRMIREDSGIAKVSELFDKINRPKLSGPIIERIRELRAEMKEKHKN